MRCECPNHLGGEQCPMTEAVQLYYRDKRRMERVGPTTLTIDTGRYIRLCMDCVQPGDALAEAEEIPA